MRSSLTLIDAHSRERVAIPLLRAMPDQRLLLVRADGTHIAIDATASPIRDAQGEVVGGVLLLRKAG